MKQWTCYFDTAGSETDADGTVLVTAGVVSTIPKWGRFDQTWLRVLAEEGIRDLHMRELVPAQGQFKGWDEPRKDALLGRLMAETRRGVHKIFVTVVVLPHYRAFNERFQLTETIGGPYALAQGACVTQAFQWLFDAKHGRDGAGFYVAHGDNGQGRFMQMMVRERAIVPEVARTTTASGETITPFQVADFVAWEYRRIYDAFIRTQQKVRPRPSMAAIRRTLPVSVSVCDDTFLADFCDRLVPLREQ